MSSNPSSPLISAQLVNNCVKRVNVRWLVLKGYRNHQTHPPQFGHQKGFQSGPSEQAVLMKHTSSLKSILLKYQNTSTVVCSQDVFLCVYLRGNGRDWHGQVLRLFSCMC